MRLSALLSGILFAAAIAVGAQAAPLSGVSDINITIGPDLQAKADTYGQRDLDGLVVDLRQSVERELARNGGLARDGAALNLVIEDAVPNRPTFRQLSRSPGLSYESFGIGGATVGGSLVTADGQDRPLHFTWYESDIWFAQYAGTWSDARKSFDRFARSLARGEALAER
ncbi:MAG: hypothetical protein Q8L66_03210 [Caulobacter sp.]|nr:hypothetical protein [Caulobacter sp.]